MLLRKTQYPYIKRFLTGCSANYQNAIDLIRKSMAALDAKGYADAKHMDRRCLLIKSWVNLPLNSSWKTEELVSKAWANLQ